MPFNRPISAERDAALLSHVADWDGYFLTLACRGRTCPTVHLPIARFVREHGDRHLPDFCRRLRCQGCRKRPATITLRRVSGGVVEASDLTLPLFGGAWAGV